MPPRTALIRADASSEMGIGHVMRCLALGHAWQSRGGRVVFALALGVSDLEDRILSQSAEIAKIDAVPGTTEDSTRTLALAERYEAAWLVVDGYHFSADYLRSLAVAKPRLLVIADNNDFPRCDCDIVVDPNLESCEMPSEYGDGKQLLRGPAYALLRPEFLNYPRAPKRIPRITHRVLITFGGGDFPNASLTVLHGLQDTVSAELDVTIAIGPSNPHRAELEVAARKSRHNVKLLENIRNMAAIMAPAELGITAAGGTCYELAFMQVPMFLISIAENQKNPAKAYATANAAVVGGQVQTLSRPRLARLLDQVISDRGLRAQMVENARNMVDGNGAERIVERMLAVGESKRQNRELLI